MWAGDRSPGPLGRALRLSAALALVLACWSTGPASANVALPTGQGVSAAAPAPANLPLPTPDAAALHQGAAHTAGQVRPVVAAAAEAVAFTAAPGQAAAGTAPAVGSTAPAIAATPPAAGVQRRSLRIRASAAQTRADASRSGTRRRAGQAAPRPAAADAGVLAQLLSGAGSAAAAPAPESSPSAAPGPAAAAPDLPSGPDRRSTALQGSAAAGVPTSLLLAGFALLLGALALAGPRLQRHFSIGPAACRPAAFVALLERPG
jgi:hypothetical protein